jgi:hypothetical protein
VYYCWCRLRAWRHGEAFQQGHGREE